MECLLSSFFWAYVCGLADFTGREEILGDLKILFFFFLRPFLTRNIFDKYLGCLGPKKLSKIFLENIIWEIWEASYGSEIFFSVFDGGM